MVHAGNEESVTIEVDEDGMVVLACPMDSRHRFKGYVDDHRITRAVADPYPCWCPYCGHRCTLLDLAPFLADRLDAASQRLADQFAEAAARDLASVAARITRTAGPGLGLRVEVSTAPGRRVPVRPQPIELTRLDLTCQRCGERAAIYGRAAFCWQCGALPPAQTAAEGLRALRGRLDLVDRDDLPISLREYLTDHGLHESLEWDAYVHGVALVESYLMALYEKRAESPKRRSRIEDWQAVLDLPVHGWPQWASFTEAREVRNSIVHRGGRVDLVLHEGAIATSQRIGERLRITTTQARALVDELADVISKVTQVHGDAVDP